MSESPIVVHVLRPYGSVEEYLRAEAWTIELRGMLLIDAAELPVESAVLFDVALGKGEKVIRAEGKVTGFVTPRDGDPGGLRVRFKRYGASTKAFIERAVQAHKAQVAEAPAPEVSSPSLPEIAAVSIVTSAPVQAPESAPVSVGPMSAAPVSDVSPQAPPRREPSGVHRRPLAAADVPENRDALLARLRERAQSLGDVRFEDKERGTG